MTQPIYPEFRVVEGQKLAASWHLAQDRLPEGWAISGLLVERAMVTDPDGTIRNGWRWVARARPFRPDAWNAVKRASGHDHVKGISGAGISPIEALLQLAVALEHPLGHIEVGTKAGVQRSRQASNTTTAIVDAMLQELEERP